MTRAQPALRRPVPDLRLTHFPSIAIPDTAYRAHSPEYGPWYFSDRLDGRFGVPSPHGTCHLADSAEVAVREWLGPVFVGTTVISRAQAELLRVSQLTTQPTQLAHLNHPLTAPFGITDEINTDTRNNYAVPQAWAQALHASGFGGVRYRARFTPAEGSNAVALFGKAGEHPSIENGEYLTGVEALEACGFMVLGPPASTRLTLAKPTAKRRRPRPR